MPSNRRRKDRLPNQSIYIHNLNDKLKKEDLRQQLYYLFSQVGPVIDVVAMKTVKMRGQAFVVFQDVPTAASALRQLQGFEFFGKNMRIEFAASKSDAAAKLDGTFDPKKKRKQAAAAAELEEKKPSALHEVIREKKKQQAMEVEETPAANGSRAGAGSAEGPANKLLFVQDLPEDATKEMVTALFKQFPGFSEVRMVESKPGICFVEFSSAEESTVAHRELQGYRVSASHKMSIAFAK
eukprot:Rmarinus@m.17355